MTSSAGETRGLWFTWQRRRLLSITCHKRESQKQKYGNSSTREKDFIYSSLDLKEDAKVFSVHGEKGSCGRRGTSRIAIVDPSFRSIDAFRGKFMMNE